MNFCPECGNKLIEGAKFCPECGKKLIEIVPEETKTAAEEARVKASSEEYIIRMLNKFKDIREGVYVAPEIPAKILLHGASVIAGDINPKLVIGLIDTSVLKNGKNGAVFTGTRMYLPSVNIEFEKVAQCALSTEIQSDNEGRAKSIEVLRITCDDDEVIELRSKDTEVPLAILNEILCGISENVDSFESSNQLITLSELSDSTVSAYLKIVIHYLKAEGGMIDAGEYKELISLMTKIKTSKAVHKELQEYRFSKKASADFRELVEELETELKKDKVSVPVIFQALFMDLLLMRKDKLDSWKEDGVLCEMQGYLNVTDQQVDFLVKKIKLDEQILSTRMDDKQINGLQKELAAVAGGAGIALGALALTGSITMGAFGVGSGLLGLFMASGGGAALGLLAVAGAGYGAYRGVKYFAGTSEMEGYGMRISALQEKIKMMNAANAYIIEDINYLGQKLGVLTAKIKETNELNHEIMEELELYISFSQSVSESGELIQEDSRYTQREYWIQSLPEKLDFHKYNELVENSVDKFDINELVLFVYDSEREYVLSEECETEAYEKAAALLKEIGYFDTKAATVAQAKSMAKQGLSSLKKGISQVVSNEELPERLDFEKYSGLVESRSDRAEIDGLILSLYDRDNDYVLREDCEKEDGEKALGLLKEIGYLETISATVEQAKSKAKQGWSKLKKGILG